MPSRSACIFRTRADIKPARPQPTIGSLLKPSVLISHEVVVQARERQRVSLRRLDRLHAMLRESR